MFRSSLVILPSLFCFTLSPLAIAKTYKVDTEHTSIGFSVKHLGISSVKGSFKTYESEFFFNEKSKIPKTLSGSIDVSSIDTQEKDRDKHLLSPDFFGIDTKNPKLPNNTIVVDIKSFEVPKGSTNGKAKADITIKGIKKTIDLDVEEIGYLKNDGFENERAAFTLKGKINREDFGLKWNKLIETGGLLVGKEVSLDISIQGIAKS